jgi:hypothetical protein
MAEVKPPTGTKAAGRRLWRSVTEDYDLTPAELAILGQAARVADVLDQLAAIIDAGPLIDAETGRTASAVGEFRQQSITLARLIAALRLPDGAGAVRAQRRGTRGVYALRDTT